MLPQSTETDAMFTTREHHMTHSFELALKTPASWTQAVLKEFDRFLIDHAACEKKAAGMAISMLSHYPDRAALVTAMSDLAVEEMSHFREVIKLIQTRGLELEKDEKDPYIHQLKAMVATGKDAYFLDRLLMASLVEARGAERFGLIAQALSGPGMDLGLQRFYQALAQSETRHYTLFLKLAHVYFSPSDIAARLDEWINYESEVMQNLAIRPALH